MNTKPGQYIFAFSISLVLAFPTYARGGGGFGGGGGRSFGGGGRSFGGGGRSFGGDSGRSFSSRDAGASGFGGRSSSGSHDFGGGFNEMSGGAHPSMGGQMGSHGGQGAQGFDRGGQGAQGYDRGGQGAQGFDRNGQGFGNHGDMPISTRPAMPDHLPTDGGFGSISGFQNKGPQKINNTDLHNQGQNVRNSFNNDQFNHTNQYNNVNVNRNAAYGNGNYGHNGAYGHYGDYGHYGYGSNHPYGAGYAHGYWNGSNCWGAANMNQAAMWTCMGMSSLTTFLGMGLMGAEIAGAGKNKTTVVAAAPQPVSTTNITYSGDNVYVNGQPSCSSTQYYQQAQQLASQWAQPGYPPLAPDLTGGAAATTSADEFAPLGVFSLAEPGQTQANTMLQLAINKQGVVRGNYLNQLTNERSQLYGMLDKKTQRISWTIGQNNNTVFDTSLPDLVKNESQVLVHYSPTNTQEMALIRLPAPTDGSGASVPVTPTS